MLEASYLYVCYTVSNKTGCEIGGFLLITVYLKI